MKIKNSVLSSILATILLCSCGKPSLTGQYINQTDSADFYKFTSDGHWITKGGTAGTYSVDGETLILNGPMGVSISGVIKGDRITVSEPKMMGRPAKEKTYSKK